MGKIRIAISGIGNCACSLLQGIEYYKGGNPADDEKDIGLMHYDLGGYLPGDIEVVAAFDVDARKVGKPLEKAMFAPPNCTKTFYDRIPNYGVRVRMGPVKDGISPAMKRYPEHRRFIPAKKSPCDVVKVLKKSGAEILVNYLPVGSQKGVEFYASCCLKAGISFINCIPVFVVSNPKWEKKFRKAGIAAVGDDIKAQVGATIVHRVLTKLFEDRGVRLDRTYQLNTGGNTDFLNMLDSSRLASKRISKTDAVQSQMKKPLDGENIHIGPSDYVPWQLDNKVCFLRMEGRGFGGVGLNLELRLSVEDSPNSAGVAIDAIRCCKLAKDRKIGGALTSISSYTMKHPPVQYSDSEARQLVEDFIEGNVGR